jgi:serine/threonine protein kinase
MPVRIESHAEPIPGYRLIERIGGGGFGEVWKAEAPGGLLKAMKFVYGDLQTAGDDGARAEQELKALSRVKTVRHPYILSLERYDIIDGQLIIVMELADRNLYDRYKECRADGMPGIPRDELLRYMEESAEALDLMNIQYQLQHLDIKPHNIFLTHNHIKVADFGLVKDLEGMVASVTGGVTPVYAAPETFDGYVSRFCDQYSLAIVYQELLTGQRPFTGTSVRQLIMQHLQTPPKLNALPPSDRDVIGKALAKVPDERHRTCREMVRCLRQAGIAAATPAQPKDAVAGASASADRIMSPEPVEPAAPVPDDVTNDTPSKNEDQPVEMTHCVRRGEASRSLDSMASMALLKPRAEAPAGQPGEQTRFNQTREAAGDGVIIPALVIGLGEWGRQVLVRLRGEIRSKFTTDGAASALRLLYMDTDLDAVRDVVRDSVNPLATDEVFGIRLNRPSYYLKPRDSRDTRPALDCWFDPQMLYRITRAQRTGGVRALGRLAFCDNYTNIVRRLREELTLCADPERVTTADRATGLGVRRFRPRIYIITNLAGGSGSGMFLDTAYVVRHVLRQAGLGEPDLVGLCFLPTVSKNAAQVMPTGNTFAALAELNHFATSGRTFIGRFDEKEGPLKDSSAPFNRCIVLPLPDESNDRPDECTGNAAELVYRELLSPLGRAADQRRSELSPPRGNREPSCQTFGMYRFAFPRRDLVRQVARRLCGRLVEQWMSKDSTPLQPYVEAWVQENWAGGELGVEALISMLQDGATRLLGQSPESIVTSTLQPILAQNDGESDKQADLAPEIVIDALKAIDVLLGRPGQDVQSPLAGRVAEALTEASSVLIAEWGQKLAAIVVRLIEEPEYRLAGAEEAIRQIVARIERTLQNHEQLGQDLNARSAEARARIQALLRALPTLPSAKARAAASAEIRDFLQNFPKWRNQCLLLQTVGRALVGLRGTMNDQLREINFCRVRLGELAQVFGVEQLSVRARLLDEPAEALPPPLPGQVRCLLPAGCKTLQEAVEHFVRDTSPDDLHALDAQVQVMIAEQFRSLFQVCMASANVLKNVEIALEEEAARAAEQRINTTDVAALFLEIHSNDEQAQGEIAGAFAEAAPDLPGTRSGPLRGELCLLCVPATEPGGRLKDLARQALPDVPWVFAQGGDEIVIYRETPLTPLAELAQLGPVAQEAYRQMTAVEHFTPHNRIDVKFVREPATK